MTIRPIGTAQPRVPSHRVEIARDSIVLLSRDDDLVIFDEDVRAIRAQTFAKRLRKRPHGGSTGVPARGYCLTTIVHGDANDVTRIRLRWSENHNNRMHAYRHRIAGKLADRMEESIRLQRSLGGDKWNIRDGDLVFQDGRKIPIGKVSRVRFFGDDATVWTESTNPIRIAADEPDQLVLSEFLRRQAANDQQDSPVQSANQALGRKLFAFHSDARCAISRLIYRIKDSAIVPMMLAFASAAAFFTVVTLAGAVNAIGAMPGPDDWRRIPPLPVLYLGAMFVGLVCFLFDTARELVHEFLRPRCLTVYERGLVVKGLSRRKIAFTDIVGFGFQTHCEYRESRFAYSKHHLRLSIAKGDDVVIQEVWWYEPWISRGEIQFLNQMLTIATAAVGQDAVTQDAVTQDAVSQDAAAQRERSTQKQIAGA